MRKITATLLMIFGAVIIFSGCFASEKGNVDNPHEKTQAQSQLEATTNKQKEDKLSMKLIIGESTVPVTWEDNPSVKDLQKHLPLTIQMSKYGGFEQVGPIGHNIVSNDKETTTAYGDIVLYANNKLVIFYGSNSWSYTRLGHIDLSQQEMIDLLADRDVKVILREK